MESTTHPSVKTWTPSLGCWRANGGFSFRVWAPAARDIQLTFREADAWARTETLHAESDGFFSAHVSDVSAGALYGYRVNGQGPFPDPASRFQPEGVHGPSQVVDPSKYAWSDGTWGGIEAKDVILYELHIGTFTPQGTFESARQKLAALCDLGVTVIEIMPVADFPGSRNWGYDGVDLFAPARCYGTPDDFRKFVDEAHQMGLGVLLDVVFNHLGPDGNYVNRFSPYYFTDRHHSPWGDGVNLDGPHSRQVRDFFIENGLYWLHEFHLDGLRLDATHALVDESSPHFLREFSERLHQSLDSRPIHLIAEDHRNLATMIEPVARSGWGLDGVWADDFHHEMRRLLAGDHEGYYEDYVGSIENVARSIQQGWLFTGEMSKHLGILRGTNANSVPLERFVIFLQNHDQVGNRALGERLHHQIDGDAYRAAAALWLLCPETPMLFMGQEWAATSPFLFFTDHSYELGHLITEGRRKEFNGFSAFSEESVRRTIPDPQNSETFRKSQLCWEERDLPPHTGVLRLFRELLALRRQEPCLRDRVRSGIQTKVLSHTSLLLVQASARPAIAVVAHLQGEDRVDITLPGGPWSILFHTQEDRFSGTKQGPELQVDNSHFVGFFDRPCTVILKQVDKPHG